MTLEEILKKKNEEDEALKNLSWETVRHVRNANGGLYPLNWDKVRRHWKDIYGTLEIDNEKEFESKLKALCASLYGWNLYEQCPMCKSGKLIPVYFFRQYTPFCGCSNFPECDFRLNREGNIF